MHVYLCVYMYGIMSFLCIAVCIHVFYVCLYAYEYDIDFATMKYMCIYE